MKLFHGSSTVDPKVIYESEEGFDLRESKDTGMWGRALYFAANANYSDLYSHKLEEGKK